MRNVRHPEVCDSIGGTNTAIDPVHPQPWLSQAEVLLALVVVLLEANGVVMVHIRNPVVGVESSGMAKCPLAALPTGVLHENR